MCHILVPIPTKILIIDTHIKMMSDDNNHCPTDKGNEANAGSKRGPVEELQRAVSRFKSSVIENVKPHVDSLSSQIAESTPKIKQTIDDIHVQSSGLNQKLGESSNQMKEVFSSVKDNILNQFQSLSENMMDKKPSSPASILSTTGCKVQSLTVSDQHATLLITHPNEHLQSEEDRTEVKSLIKLTLVPFHRVVLGSNPIMNLDNPSEILENNPAFSQDIITFLQDYNFVMTSESGAEYSYYTAVPKNDPMHIANKVAGNVLQSINQIIIHNSDQQQNGTLPASTPESSNKDKAVLPRGSFHVELISPASSKQINRAMPSPSVCLINETPELYANFTKPYIQSIVDGNSLDWLQNIITGKKETERLLLDDDSFILNIDTKWRSHPDPFTVDRKEWYNHDSVVDLYCLGIVKQSGIASLRDLTSQHIPLLQSILVEGCKTIESIYGIRANQLRVFVHYQPQFYHFHVHFTRLFNEVGAVVERGHLVTDIIQNLQMDPSYYQKRTISYKLLITNPLYKLLEQNSSCESDAIMKNAE